MDLICESEQLDNCLLELNEVNYSNPIIKKKAAELFNSSQTEIDKAKIAFEFVCEKFRILGIFNQKKFLVVLRKF